jgi:hypothetical protein
MSAAAAGLASAGAAIDYVASDLSFTLAFQIALELLSASREADLTDDTLVAYVIALGILINTVPRTALSAYRLYSGKEPRDVLQELRQNGALAFLIRFLKIAERIILSVIIQLIASSARGGQAVRLQRVLSLASTSLFFMFLEKSSTMA